MEYLNETIKKCHNEYVRLMSLWDKALDKLESKSNIFNRSKLQKEYDEAGKNFNEYSRNIYAKAIYDTYDKIKPTLIRIKTGESRLWEEVFKLRFEELGAVERSILVGLVENSGGYRFK